jgi:hypothetical protein
MPVSYRLQFDTRDAERAFKRLHDRAPLAIMRALNRSIASARTAVASPIAKDLGMKVGDARDRIAIREARLDTLVAQLRASAQRIPLIEFKATGPEPSRGRGRGVTSRLKGGTSRIPDAFIATMRSGHRGVFKRVNLASPPGALTRKGPGAWSKNLPIYQLVGPSIVHVFEKFAPLAIARAEEQLKKNLAHELRFAMGQSAGGATP